MIEVQNPGTLELIIFPALLVSIAGLLLLRRFRIIPAALMAACVPGVALVLLTTVDEWVWVQDDPGRLFWWPAGWAIWTMLSLPGTLMGVILLVVLHLILARQRGSD